MTSHGIVLKKVNMLCNKCVLHVLKVLTKIEEIEELEINLNKKLIKIEFRDNRITKEMIERTVNNAIEGIRPFRVSETSR